MPDNKDELRAKILQAAQNNFDEGDYITDSQDWRRFLDDCIEINRNQLKSLKAKLQKEQCLLPTTCTHDSTECNCKRYYVIPVDQVNNLIDELIGEK